jgi:TfoX/Sxy family transcriptional regulator of competence genes
MTAEKKLVADVRAHFAAAAAIGEVRMFGGIGFLLNGNMVAAVSKRGLLLRVGKDGYHDALGRPGARPMEMRGRPVEGYVFVDPRVLKDGALETWLDAASRFVQTLPPKAATGKSTRKGKPT